MYLILDATKRIVAMSNHASFVRRQNNGVVILCPEESADAIYADDSNTFWELEAIGQGYCMELVEDVPDSVSAGFYFYHAGEFYTTEADLQALALAKTPELASLMFVQFAETGQIDDVTATEHAEQFADWAYPISYVAGQIRTDPTDGNIYRVNDGQGHTSQEGWNPSLTPALWSKIGDPTAEWPDWSQPIGSADTYPLGAKTTHADSHWVSTVANNVWEPGVYGWEAAE